MHPQNELLSIVCHDSLSFDIAFSRHMPKIHETKCVFKITCSPYGQGLRQGFNFVHTAYMHVVNGLYQTSIKTNPLNSLIYQNSFDNFLPVRSRADMQSLVKI